jgi:hypothetical protein
MPRVIAAPRKAGPLALIVPHGSPPGGVTGHSSRISPLFSVGWRELGLFCNFTARERAPLQPVGQRLRWGHAPGEFAGRGIRASSWLWPARQPVLLLGAVNFRLYFVRLRGNWVCFVNFGRAPERNPVPRSTADQVQTRERSRKAGPYCARRFPPVFSSAWKEMALFCNFRPPFN